jgi:hypothetical protein
VFCAICGAGLAAGARYCPSCGNAVSVSETRSSGGNTPPPTSPSAPEVTSPQTSIDFRRLGTGDFMAGGATVVVFIALLLPWYSLDGFSTSALGSGAGGWRFLSLLLTIAIIGYLFARTLVSSGFRLPLPHWQLLTLSTSINGLIILLAFLIKPSGQLSWSFGAYLGLIAAILAIVGSAIRGNEPEVIGPDHLKARATFATRPSGFNLSQTPAESTPPSQPATAPAPAPIADLSPLVSRNDPITQPSAAELIADDRAVELIPNSGDRLCPSCGAAVPQTNRFCNACGAAVA